MSSQVHDAKQHVRDLPVQVNTRDYVTMTPDELQRHKAVLDLRLAESMLEEKTKPKRDYSFLQGFSVAIAFRLLLLQWWSASYDKREAMIEKKQATLDRDTAKQETDLLRRQQQELTTQLTNTNRELERKGQENKRMLEESFAVGTESRTAEIVDVAL